MEVGLEVLTCKIFYLDKKQLLRLSYGAVIHVENAKQGFCMFIIVGYHSFTVLHNILAEKNLMLKKTTTK